MNATQQHTTVNEKPLVTKPETKKENIYLLPGLLADSRIFKNFATGQGNYIDVIYPEPHRKESLAEFAKRLAEQITEPDAVLVGTSFGGVLSIEIAKHINVKQVILLGSVKHQDELAWYKNIIHILRLHKRVSARTIRFGGMASRFFAPKQTRELQTFFDMVYSTEGHYIHWVIDRVLGWKNTEYPENILHLHGTSDPLFPIRYITEPVVRIQGAGHSMVMDRANDLHKAIKEYTGIII